MNSYASITLLSAISYGKAYLDNQFSLKADVSQLSDLVNFGYLHLKYSNSVQISENYYNKAETGNLFATNISTTGGASISGNLEAQRLTLNKQSNDSEMPLRITNSNQNWEVIALGSTIAGDGCFQNCKTAQSPTIWNTGIWNQNKYGIRHGVNGIWI